MTKPTAPQDRSEESAPRVLVIDRSKWQRGLPDDFDGDTYLLDQSGMMCCLGFDAIACGIARKRILSVQTPAGITGALPWSYRAGRFSSNTREHTMAVATAMDINDNALIDDPEREALLIPVLKQLGWDDVRFVDGLDQ